MHEQLFQDAVLALWLRLLMPVHKETPISLGNGRFLLCAAVAFGGDGAQAHCRDTDRSADHASDDESKHADPS